MNKKPIILVEDTIEKFGYNPLELNSNSAKKVITICDICKDKQEVSLNYLNKKITVSHMKCYSALRKNNSKNKYSIEINKNKLIIDAYNNGKQIEDIVKEFKITNFYFRDLIKFNNVKLRSNKIERPLFDKELLIDLRINQNKSATDIAKELNVNYKTVKYNFELYDIPLKNNVYYNIKSKELEEMIDLYLNHNFSLSQLAKKYGFKNKEQVRYRLIANNVKLREAKGYKKYIIPKELLEKLYLENKMSMQSISEYFNNEIPVASVKRNLVEHDIPIATKEEQLAKQLKTMYENEVVPTSKQQRKIHEIVGGTLNYIMDDRFFLDIGFPEEKIYIEYDGSGHGLGVKIGKVSKEEFDKKEKARYYYLKNRGWKKIKIVSETDKLPDDKELSDLLFELLRYIRETEGTNYVCYDLDNKKYTYKKY